MNFVYKKYIKLKTTKILLMIKNGLHLHVIKSSFWKKKDKSFFFI